MADQKLLATLNNLASETPNPLSSELDALSTREILYLINQADKSVADAIEECLDDIAICVELATTCLKRGGRLIYVGAGTSGRLGVLDAAECPPTFSVDNNTVLAIIAGGEKALIQAVEGAEDSHQGAINDLKRINLKEKDMLIGIAASGRTPYTISALKYAKQLGAKTSAIACNEDAPLFEWADCKIFADVGQEILTGSTRMKAGTAQKLILNMISTTCMTKLGKVYKNLMVDVHASNEKLRARAVNIVMQATGCALEQAQSTLDCTNMQVKLAILVILTGLDVDSAQSLLDRNEGFLRRAINAHQ